jgi:succinoglycan biosynthesis transport protein ExoP
MIPRKTLPPADAAIASQTIDVTPLRRFAAQEDDFSFAELWRVLRKRRWIITATVLGLTALALAVSVVMTPKYESVSTIEVNKESSDMLGLDDMAGMAAGGGADDALDYNVTLQTQANVLQSDTLALQVIQQLDLEKHLETPNRFLAWLDFGDNQGHEKNLPLEKAPKRRMEVLKAFHKNLDVKTVSGTRMIEVHFLDRDPKVAADVVNTLVNDYLEEYFQIRFSATMQASDWLSKQLNDLKSQVESSQEKLVQYQKKAGILGTDEVNNVIMVKLEEINKQLTMAEANRILKEAVWQIAKTGDPELISNMAGSLPISPGTGGSAPSNSLGLIESLRAQQADLKSQYALASRKYGSSYPKLGQMQMQMADLESSIQAEIEKLRARAYNDFISAKQAEAMLRVSFDQQKAEANKLNDDAIQYVILKQEVDSGRDLYQGMLKKLKEAGILAGLKSTNIVVIDTASPAAEPARPKIPLNLALGLAGGLLLGIAAAFVVENADQTISTPDQAEQVSLLPSLGLVPTFAAPSKSKNGSGAKALPENTTSIAVFSEPNSQVAEAYRSLRTSILLMNADASTNVILVTSALPAEGKTTTSLNCAAALAQQGARVLLVEADMRRPNLNKNLNLKSSSGLSSLVAGSNGHGAPIVECPNVPGLFVLPAGPRPPYPAELLGSQRMAELVKKWREEYDFVVIDTPPVLSVTDAVVLSPNCDAIVLVVRSGSTTKQSLLLARKMFARASTRIAGVLINGFNLNSPDYYNYYGYYYGSEYGRGYFEQASAGE